MATAVWVQDETRRLLDRLKKEMGLKSYDDVIRRLVKAEIGLPTSLFGACRGSQPFVREVEEEQEL